MNSIINNDTMKITESAFYDMINHIGSKPSESGGAGFGYESDNVIRDFVPDYNAKTTHSSYTMDTPFLNEEIKKRWENQGKSLLMIAHAHPYGSSSLSRPDREYFESLLKYMPREKFYTPILFTIPDGGLKVFPYLYEKGSSSPQKVKFEIVADDYKEQKKSPSPKIEKSKEIETKELINNTYLIFTKAHNIKPALTDKVSSFLSIILSLAIVYGIVFFSAFYAIKFLTELILKLI